MKATTVQRGAIDLTHDDEDNTHTNEQQDQQEQQQQHEQQQPQPTPAVAPPKPHNPLRRRSMPSLDQQLLAPRPLPASSINPTGTLGPVQEYRARHIENSYQNLTQQHAQSRAQGAGGGGSGGGGSGATVSALAAAATPNEHLRMRHQAYLEEQEYFRQKAEMERQHFQKSSAAAFLKQQVATMRMEPSQGLPPMMQGGGSGIYTPAYLNNGGGGGGGGQGMSGGYQPTYTSYYQEQQQAPTVQFAVSSGGEFSAKLTGIVPEAIISSFRLTPGARNNKKKKRWYFPLAAHNNLRVAVEQVRRQLYLEKGVILQLTPIPDEVLRHLSIHKDGQAAAESEAQKQAHKKLADVLPKRLLETLAPFQREGVAFVVGREGRGLIADEMGLGKTIQAIAVATVYREEWPLLIMCPSSARFHWEAELVRWLDGDVLKKEEVQVVTAGKEKVSEKSKVVIMSYDLALRLKDVLRRPSSRSGTKGLPRFRVVVADECHYLKNASAQRTRELLPLLAEATRAVLLSGTPALSRPRELWTQLNVLNGRAWNDHASFLDRYCTGGRGAGKRKWNARGQGAANLRELHEMLKVTVMVRRRKKDILQGLPPKRRVFHKVEVPNPALRAQLARALEDLSIMTAKAKERKKANNKKRPRKNGQQQDEDDPDYLSSSVMRQHQQRVTVEKNQRGGEDGGAGDGEEDLDEWTAREIQQRKKMILMEVFKLTGTAKIPLAVDRVKELLASGLSGKVLVFAHHRDVLDGIESACLKDVPHIRIDGSTPPRERQSQVETFQTDANVRVALLSLTAAGLSLTLTAANRALFVELFWTPGALLQAEDRCHRIGQTSEVEIEYLLAEGTLDDSLWPLIQRKMRVLGELVEGAEGMNMEGHEETEEEDRLKEEGHQADAKEACKQGGGGGGGEIGADGDKELPASGSFASSSSASSFGKKKKNDKASSVAEGVLSDKSRQLLHQLAVEDRDRGEGSEKDEEEDEDAQEEDEAWESSGREDSSSGSDDEDDDVQEFVTIDDDDDDDDGGGHGKGEINPAPRMKSMPAQAPAGKEEVIVLDEDEQ